MGWRKAIAAVLCQDMSRVLQTRYPSEVVKCMLLGTGAGWSSDGDEDAGSGERDQAIWIVIVKCKCKDDRVVQADYPCSSGQRSVADVTLSGRRNGTKD